MSKKDKGNRISKDLSGNKENLIVDTSIKRIYIS